MNEQTTELFNLIQEIASKNDRGYAPISDILFWARKRGIISIHRQRIHKMLRWLHSTGKIKPSPHIFGAWIPIVTEQEKKQQNKIKTPIPVSIERIRYCIHIFYQRKTTLPLPSDIEKIFLEIYGWPERKDIARELRRFAEAGKLLRTDDFHYYYQGLTSWEPNLKTFVV